jgi:hypothetical protein
MNSYKDGSDAALNFYGITKIARVPSAVKQYRRALQGFGEASRTLQRGDPHQRATAGFALHGTGDLPGILEAGKITASPLGETGQHGAGAYFWKGFPREEYLKGLQDEGVLTDLKSLPNKRPVLPNIYSGHTNLHTAISGPGDYKLRPRDTAVIDMATRAKNKTLPTVLADAAEMRARVMDTSIFHRARQQIVASNGKKFLPSPSKLDLMKLLLRRKSGLT